jgi:mycoredoxin-dependent peroxiredoxin
MIAVGERAPDFALRDQNNEVFQLSEARGRNAVFIVFYPLAFTGICTGELYAVRDDPDTFQSERLQTIAISVDSTYAHKVFAEREGYEFALLSDFWPHGAVAQAYGAFNEQAGYANRGTVLVDPDGTVRFAELNGPGEGRDPAAWRRVIKEFLAA